MVLHSLKLSGGIHERERGEDWTELGRSASIGRTGGSSAGATPGREGVGTTDNESLFIH